MDETVCVGRTRMQWMFINTCDIYSIQIFCIVLLKRQCQDNQWFLAAIFCGEKQGRPHGMAAENDNCSRKTTFARLSRGGETVRAADRADVRDTCASSTVESGKYVTFFEQLFCFYQLVLAVWNTFGAKFILSFISWVKQNWHFLWQWRKKLPFPHLGGLLGETGVREKSFLRSRAQLPRATRFFLLDHRTTCTVFLVFAMFVMTTMAESRVRWPRIPGYKH